MTVVDNSPLAQLEAHLEGFKTTLEKALPNANALVTATGRHHAIQAHHFDMMRDSVILCNAGQNQFEMDIDAIYNTAERAREIRPNVEELILPSGKKFFLLARGNSVNLAAGDGNPIEIMDLGLSLQSLSLEFLATRADELVPGPQTVPWEIENSTVKAAISEWVG